MREINYTKHMTMKDAPVLRKTGAVAADGEFTPFVWKGRLYRLECHIIDREDGIELPCVIIVDVMERKECARFAYGLSYPSGYCEDDRIYVFGMKKRKLPEENDIAVMYCSEDMQTWAEYELFSRPEWRLWNTSVCKGPDGYRMAIEVSLDENIDEERKKALQPVIGVPFTEFFLRCDMNPGLIRHKVGASAAAARRAGSLQAIEAMNHFFLNHEMFVTGSTYWNMAYGRLPGDVAKDEEGIDNMRNLGQNMVFLLKRAAGDIE